MSRIYLFAASMLLSTLCYGQFQFSGIVLDDDGIAVSNVLIQLDDLKTVSDGEGAFTFRDVPEGTHVLSVRGVGYLDFKEFVQVTESVTREIRLEVATYNLETVELNSSWIQKDEPFTYTTIDQEEIADQNTGQDVPYLLRWLPSMVVTSDAGTGIGYTGLRIRGSDPTRINVTLDGIPVNDAESQGVFWVDLPDLASSASDIQVQRGVGTSTQGAGAFGGTINVRTNQTRTDAYGSFDLSAGSFNTRRGNVRFGTGLLNDHLVIEGRLSSTDSDGYIDRGSADLKSLHLATTWIDDRSSLKFKVLSGKEVTYQAWNGVPAQYLDDPDLRTTNTAGIRADGSFHPNEVDDYTQTHTHLIYKRDLGSTLFGQLGLHHTKGKGFFEQYRIGDALEDYALTPIQIGGETIAESDLIRRRWLDNDFYGLIFSLGTESADLPLTWSIGGGANTYRGDHFGEVIWARYFSEGELGHEYYRDDAIKNDFNIYTQLNHSIGDNFSIFGDLQWRHVNYQFLGFNEQLMPSDQQSSLHFFNPKFGAFYKSDDSEFYYSFAVAHREPNRDDYVNSSTNSRPLPEALFDHELGWRMTGESFGLSANLYYMKYRDQLVPTGNINDVGAYTRTNVPDSYRLGLELAGSWRITDRLDIAGNATFSQNRINQYREFIDNWDTGEQAEVQHKDVPLAFSPSSIAQGSLRWKVADNETVKWSIDMLHKFVGEQYFDNTGSDQTKLDSYYFSDLRMILDLYPSWIEQISLKVILQNVFDADLVTNAWSYRYISPSYDARPDDPHARLEEGTQYNLSGYYPQAGRNIMIGVTFHL